MKIRKAVFDTILQEEIKKAKREFEISSTLLELKEKKQKFEEKKDDENAQLLEKVIRLYERELKLIFVL